jgi:hypothetical protein
MKNILIFFTFCSLTLQSQILWPKSYPKAYIETYNIIEDNDEGFLAICTYNNDYNSYLLKFDANGDLLWKKCITYNKRPELWVTSIAKDKFKNTYLIGSTYDTDSAYGDAFILSLDSCFIKTKSVVYTDTQDSFQQYFAYQHNISDSLFLIEGWGFNQFDNNYFVINKSDLYPRKVYNLLGSHSYSSVNYKGSSYIELSDYFHLKDSDTINGVSRSVLLKLDEKTGNFIYYKVLGFNENIVSEGFNIFNSGNNLNAFSCFYDIPGQINNNEYSPMLFICDTNGVIFKYFIYPDKSIEQMPNNVLKYNDSIYFMTLLYQEWNNTSSYTYKIKFYKLNNKGDLVDSFYMNNWGRKFYFQPGADFVHLMKNKDGKIMCAFTEKDSNMTHPRITFLRFDQNFKLDTTEYRNIKYDGGCSITNDTITLEGYKLINLQADSVGITIRLKDPNGIIKVPQKAKFAFYPNPVKDEASFEFEYSMQGPIKIILTDTRGVFVRELYDEPNSSQGKKQFNFDFSKISRGMYFISVYSDKGLVHSIRMIKQ